MEKFRKLIEAGPIGLQPWAEEKLRDYADEIVRYSTLPESEEELISRIGDADALLVRTLPLVPASVLSKCSNLKYVGMCCSLYSKESANVDIAYAEKHGITVYGIRDYGDRGVTEFVVLDTKFVSPVVLSSSVSSTMKSLSSSGIDERSVLASVVFPLPVSPEMMMLRLLLMRWLRVLACSSVQVPIST